MGDTSIEWTDWSLNALRARLNGRTGHYCVKVSPGCRNCYSSRLQPRFGLPQFQEQRGDGAPEVYLDPKKLGEVLRRKKPTKIFWCDMTDMFGDWVPFKWIAACFGVMAATPQHTHQCLTKRPDRMLEFFSLPDVRNMVAQARDSALVDAAHDPVESWKSIPGFVGYEASSHGRVRSERVEILATTIGASTGRETVTLWNHGNQETVNVHQVTAAAHLGAPPDGFEVCHRNGDKRDNRLANLRYGTRSENQQEKVRHGARGGPQKLTAAQVEEIRAARRGHEKQQVVADRFGVSRSLVSLIESGKVWAPPADLRWPLPNVHLGVSCEDKRRADERIPLLLSCPAAVRWVSAEPLLESIDFQRIPANHAGAQWDMVEALTGREYSDEELFPLDDKEDRPVASRIDWVVVGGESGQRARPCDIGWIGDIVDQCRDAGVPVFVKQLGKRPVDGSVPVRVDSVIEPGFAMAGGGSALVAYPIRSTKGGDPEEWPAELCIRMMPGEAWE